MTLFKIKKVYLYYLILWNEVDALKNTSNWILPVAPQDEIFAVYLYNADTSKVQNSDIIQYITN